MQRVDIAMDDDTLHFYNVHLGTSLLERRHQAAKLASVVHDRRVVGPKIVLGDFNEWARGIAKDVLAERLQSIDLSKHLQPAPDLSGILSDPAPRSHLLRGEGRSR